MRPPLADEPPFTIFSQAFASLPAFLCSAGWPLPASRQSSARLLVALAHNEAPVEAAPRRIILNHHVAGDMPLPVASAAGRVQWRHHDAMLQVHRFQAVVRASKASS